MKGGTSGYMALQDGDDPAPYGVIRHKGGIVERYNDGDGWFDSPVHVPYVYGGASGAHPITAAESQGLIASGTLVRLSQGDVEHLRAK